MSKVSVIIPTYNRSSIIGEAIKSVISQDFVDFEVIVVDDGSNDRTSEVLDSVSDPRVRSYRKIHGGVSSARNLGLTKANGDYIAFLDSDDMWPEYYLRAMLSSLEMNPEYDVAYAAFVDVYPDGRREEYYRTRKPLSGHLTINMFFEAAPAILPSASVCRKTALDGFFFDENLMHEEDLDAWLRLSTYVSFLHVPDVSVTRNRSPLSLSQQATESLSPNVPLIWERFYFHLGGHRILPAKLAKKKIARLYRRLARNHLRTGSSQSAMFFVKKSLSYRPFDLRCYKFLFRALLKGYKKGLTTDWKAPEVLPPYILANGCLVNAREET